ncbi:MAG TPA: ribonuclease R [Bacteroidia bacterium]|nr:ribonuclease R [Bacteroidia bacterium]HNU34706.1 ribonuclease R [Bacteroidia bacterium]
MTNTNNFSAQEVEQIKNLIPKALNEHPYKIFNLKQLSKRVEFLLPDSIAVTILKSDDGRILHKTIEQLCDELIKEEKIISTDKYKFKALPVTNIVEGEIEFVKSGNAYVSVDGQADDIYIAASDTMNAINGDSVRVSLYATRPGKQTEGEVVEIVRRNKTDFVGIVQITDRYAFLLPDDNKMHVDIFIPAKFLNGATEGVKAIARITNWTRDNKNPTGEIIEVLGKPGDNNVEMNAILVEYGFPTRFPEAVEKEADNIPYEISAAEIKKRKDFRKTTTFTIDPVDAKDFDDALSIKKLANGNFEIGVHIADVSHYLKEDSEMEKEAFNRATSVYLVDRVIPMLPEKLSNHVCSLRPHEDKLCYSAVFEINDKAEVLSEWFGRTVIHSQRRFTYEEAQEIIETGKGDLQDEILLFDRLAKILRKHRMTQGAVSFEKSEVKFKLDKDGNPVGVYVKEAKDSNKLIEEFMLLANRKVAERIGKYGREESQKSKLKSADEEISSGKAKPQKQTKNQYTSQEKGKKPTSSEHQTQNSELTFVYRIHDVPVEDKLTNFAAFAGRFGYRVKTSSPKEIAHSLNKLLEDVRGKSEQNMIEQLAIRSMAKAIYSTNNIGHYGLAFDYYTHFTSPIRRYPDVMVHRLLEHYLNRGKNAHKEVYEKKCKHSTDMEIQAADAERASVKYKQVQFIQARKNEIFEGVISGVTEWGMYIELEDSKCEGLIRMRDLQDDFYMLDEKNYCIVGQRKKKKFQLGDKVTVAVKSTDLVKKQIDFMLYDENRIVDPFKRSDKTRHGSQKNKMQEKNKPKKKKWKW